MASRRSAGTGRAQVFMGATAVNTRPADQALKVPDLLACSGPSEQLRMNAAVSPALTAFMAQPDRDVWSGREARSFSFADADVQVDRLADFFRSLSLAADAVIAVALPNGPEACLTIVALDRAGITPALIPVATPREIAAALVEKVGAVGVVTQSRVDELLPALEWRDIAAGYFGLRFPMAFGPDVPDGLIDLDGAAAPSGIAPTESDGEPRIPGFVTFENDAGDLRPVFRSWRSALAATETFLATAGYRRGDRIVGLLAQDDFRSLTTGLLAALSSGATLLSHGLFSGAAFLRSLDHDGRIVVVAPGWMEADLASIDLGNAVAKVVLVHEAPVRFKARAPLTHGVVDALAFGETALLSRARDARGQFALSLEPATAAGPSPLLETRRDEHGRIFFRGPAAETSSWRSSSEDVKPRDWRASRYVADVFAGIVIGVSDDGARMK